MAAFIAWYIEIHRALSKRFPFAIFYTVYDEMVSIHAVVRLPTQADVDHRTSEVGLVFCKCGEAREEIEIRLFMKPVRLGSAAIAAVRYDEKKRTLYVEFREGDTYRYSHVPEFVYRELLKAESAGAFWNAIKDQFEYEKLN